MKKGQVYDGFVERMDFPNKGIVRVDTEEGAEYAVVKDALPGRRVSFAVTKRRGGKAEGRLKGVVAPAECETANSSAEAAGDADDRPGEGGKAACPYAGICGGCLYQGFPYEETLRIKEGQIRRLLGAYTEDAVYEGIVRSPLPEGYRNKMEYTFGDACPGGPLELGLHKRGSFYDIVSVPECRIAPADFGKILAYTLEFFRERKYMPYHRMKHSGVMRHLLLRRGEGAGELLAALVTTSELSLTSAEASGLLSEWAEGLKALPLEGRFAGILHIVNDSPADAVKCDRLEILYGEDHFTEHILELQFQVSTFSFFQTNSRGAEKLYTMARELLGSGGVRGTVYDLYSGTGTIAQLLSPAAERVVGVEIVEEAVEAAKVNAERNGITNCEFIAGDVLKVLDELSGRPDVVVLDPPRDGVHPKALSHILSYGVEKILYISCKPTSLARDMEAITAAGYRIARWGMVDMFPYTGNVEVATLLERVRNAKEHIEITIDAEDYYRIKDSEKKQDE